MSPSDFSQLLSALASINYKLDWVAAAANEYDPKLLAGAGKALDFEPVYIALGTTPFQADSPAIKQYEALFEKYLPSSTRKQAALGLNSFSAWLLFAQSVKSCGGNVTPKCVYDAAHKVTNWDGGGLQAPSNPSNGNVASACIAIVKAVVDGLDGAALGTRDRRASTARRPTWWPSPGNYGTGTKLSDVGKSMSDLP